MQFLLLLRFQPYHTGIEILSRNLLTANVAIFQPYHTGIEIRVFQRLKVQPEFLSTVPYWNWNLDRVMQDVLGITFNRTILELKYNWMEIHLGREKLSTVPYWNWNSSAERWLTCTPSLSTVPYWNWNIWTPSPPSRTTWLSTVPYWNWNL